jgi:alkanesulfonate monooxygenase SsuD/methylene tetrahydromethanopterin reductase-like flavin-dependent oxidoreductase (luciferase family)
MPEQPFAHAIRKEKPRKVDGLLRFGMMWPNSPSSNGPSKVISAANANILDPQTHIDLVRAAEDVGIDFVFFADGYTAHSPANAAAGHGEPRIMATVWAPVLMGVTEHIGIVTTMHARYLSPVVLARLGANLDVLSGGRWGWNLVPGSKGSEADLLGIELPEHDERYVEVEEVLAAVRALWGAQGRPIHFEGKYSHHDGTPVGPYPVQAQPPIFNPGVSPVARSFIARAADYAFIALTDDLATVKATIDALNESCADIGRDPLEVRAMASTGIVIDSTSQGAKDRYDWIVESIDLDAARGWASTFLASSQTYQAAFGTDIDAAARKIGVAAGSRVLVGTAAEIADQIIDVHEQTGLTGFQLCYMTWSPAEVRMLADVFPILERAGIYEPAAKRGWSW